MEQQCKVCGAPLVRKKCDYCGARNKKSGKKARRLASEALDRTEITVVGQPEGRTAEVSRDSKQRQKVESTGRASDESQCNGESGWSDGCASGCVSPDGCVPDGCVSLDGCGDGCGCAEGCLTFIGEMIGEAIGSLFD